jgi:hypothetical protein
VSSSSLTHSCYPVIRDVTNLQDSDGAKPRETQLRYTSLNEPIAQLRWPNTKGRAKLKLKCGKCDQWVGANGGTAASSQQAFAKHQASEACLEIASRVLVTPAPTTSPAAVHQPAWPRSRHFCPGIPLVWPGPHFYASYLWHLHDEGHRFRSKLTWSICGVDEVNKTFYVRSLACDSSHADPTLPCVKCVLVSRDIDEKHRLVQTKAPTASYGHRPWLRIREDGFALGRENTKLTLQVSTVLLPTCDVCSCSSRSSI